MPGKPSAIGFGFQLFGEFPFGEADWAEEVTWKIIPLFYRDLDALSPHEPPEPLRKWIDAMKPPLQDLQDRWQEFPDLWDANKIRLDQLPFLAANFAIVQGENKDERLRRAEVLNAIRLFLNKGTDLGYEIQAAFEGLLVVITPIWAENKDPGAAFLEPVEGDDGFPEGTVFVPGFDTFPADQIALDTEFDDLFDTWPLALDIKEICRTAWLDLFFSPSEDIDLDPDDYSRIANDVRRGIEQRTLPIHVRIRNFTFDGPSAVGGGWSVPVVAENSAVGGGWSVPVVGERRAAAGGWAVPVVATPTP